MAFVTRAQAAAMSEAQRLDYLTYTILGEAVGEGPIGMAVVGQVIHNRSQDGRWPSDPVAVAGQPYQFSTNNPGAGGNQATMRRAYKPGSAEYEMAKRVAEQTIINPIIPDITGNAVQYHTIAMGWPSSWPSSVNRYGSIDIGNHRVYPQHPVPPGYIPDTTAVLTQLSVGRPLQPIRPATMSSSTRLKRETARVAGMMANAPKVIRESRVMAFDTTRQPFEVPRPSNFNPTGARPIPAAKGDMRATGTPAATKRSYAVDMRVAAANSLGFGGMDGDGQLRVSSAMKPRAVQQTPWDPDVRTSVAASVAAANASMGRNQLTIEGNADAPGSVVRFLYPSEPVGEANQEGKGARFQPTASDRVRAERRQPVVKVTSQGAQVVPRAEIDSTQNVKETVQLATESQNPALAASLASNIAAKKAVNPTTVKTAADVRLLRDANQAATKQANTARTAADTQLLRSANEQAGKKAAAERLAADTRLLREANQNALPAVPGPRTYPKVQDRLTPIDTAMQPGPLDTVKPIKLPPLMPPMTRADPVGTMPKFGDLAAMPTSAVRPATVPPVAPIQQGAAARERAAPVSTSTVKVAPQPASVLDRERARGNPLVGTPVNENKAPARVVPTLRITTTAPQPASTAARDAARSRATTTRPTTSNGQGIDTSGAPITKRQVGTASKGGVQPMRTTSPPPSSSSRPSGNGGGSSSTKSSGGGTKYVEASTGRELTPREVRSYNPDTREFETRTVYR